MSDDERARRRRSAMDMIASFRLEGITHTARERQLIDQYVAGSLTVDQLEIALNQLVSH